MDFPIEKALGDNNICINIFICSSFKVVRYSFRVEYLYCPTKQVQSPLCPNNLRHRYNEPIDILPVILYSSGYRVPVLYKVINC